MEPIPRLYYCTVEKNVSFCILKGNFGQLSTIFVSWQCDIWEETAFIFSQFCKHSVSASMFLFFFVVVVVIVGSFPAWQLFELQIYCSIAFCLAASIQLGKEVVSNWHNICNSVLSSSIAVNKYLKSITKCRVSSLDVYRQAVNCSCLPPWLV